MNLFLIYLLANRTMKQGLNNDPENNKGGHLSNSLKIAPILVIKSFNLLFIIYLAISIFHLSPVLFVLGFFGGLFIAVACLCLQYEQFL